MPETERLRIPCEGSGYPGHGLSLVWDVERDERVPRTMCQMCGRMIEVKDGRLFGAVLPNAPADRITIAHERDDVLAMIERGDYG